MRESGRAHRRGQVVGPPVVQIQMRALLRREVDRLRVCSGLGKLSHPDTIEHLEHALPHLALCDASDTQPIGNVLEDVLVGEEAKCWNTMPRLRR